MGYDFNRVSGFGKNHLKCNICLDVAKDAVQLHRCEHLFCKQCICQWIKIHRNCPVDRIRTYESHIRQPQLVILSVLSKLKISCEFASFGCDFVCNLDQIESHQEVCQYNGDKTVTCDRGCGSELTIRELSDHSCIKVLKHRLDLIEYELLEMICNPRKRAKPDDSNDNDSIFDLKNIGYKQF